MEGGGHRDSLMAALNRDALEEVFLHCSPQDLLAVGQTCGTAAELLRSSEKVWLAKLRESFGLSLRAPGGGGDGLFVRLARSVYEASAARQLRFQGVFVGGGVDEDAMHYFVDNLFRPDKAPYCSNCSVNADCIALLLDGEVPRDAEFARVRQYMIRRCRYAAALIMNVQMPEHGRDPDDIMRILEDWTDIQLEGFFKDLVGAMQAEHALGRLLLYDIPHERVAAEEQRILGVHQWLLDRPRHMKAAMLKPPGQPNAMFDSSVVPKLCSGQGSRRLAGVVHEVAASRVGTLTCPVAAGALLVGRIDHSKLVGWAAEDVLALLQQAAADPACAALNGLAEASEVAAAAAAGLLPPIVATDETLAGIWHEFDTSEAAAARQAAAAAAAGPSTSQQPQASGAGSPMKVGSGGSGDGGDAAAGPSGSGGGSQPARRPVPAGVVSWQPLLWFKFHSADEAVAFVQRNRPLIEQHGAQAIVRHRGPAPTRRGHVAAAEAEAVAAAQQQQQQQQQQQGAAAPAGAAPHQPGWLVEQLQQAAAQAQALQQAEAAHALQPDVQHAQQQAQQAQQQAQQQAHQPAPAIGVPLQGPYAVGFAAGFAAAQGAGAGVAAAAPAVMLAEPAAPPPAAGQAMAVVANGGALAGGQSDEGSDDEGSEGSSLGLGEDNLSDDSASDVDEGGQGAWLANWVQDEFGEDLAQQEQDVVVAGEGLLPFDQMDEGSSSEEEDADALLDAEEHFELDGGMGAGGAGAAAAAAAGGPAHAPPQVQPSAAETLLRAVTRRNTRARNRLRMPLSRPVGANILLVKLINQENLMAEFGDPHSWPNIDMTSVLLTGRQVELPDGVQLAP